jgi:hypothetical protein
MSQFGLKFQVLASGLVFSSSLGLWPSSHCVAFGLKGLVLCSMSALGVDEILQFVQDDDHGQDSDAVAVDGREVLAASRCRRQPSGRQLGQRCKVGAKRCGARRLEAQIHTFNRAGQARTIDHRIIAPKKSQTQRGKSKGSSSWRKWTPECVLKAAEAIPTSSGRSGKPEGGSSRTALQCRHIEAQCVLIGQEEGLKGLVAQSRKRKFRFYITNNMMDETKLPFGKLAPRKRRCLAWHSQATWSAHEDHLEDVDVIRPPRVLGRYTAATLWNLMARGSDSAGLHPRGEALPSADYYATLMAADTHSVNVLTSQCVASVQEPNHFSATLFCLQHRTGSVCEEVANKWGLLPPSFCLATNIQQGDFYDDLKVAVTAVLNKYLCVVQPSDPSCDPNEFGEEESRACEFALELLEVCYVQTRSTNNDIDDGVGAETKRRTKAKAFLQFFPPPWKGFLLHPCPSGCCGPTPCHDRAVSVDSGASLIMDVIIPHISRPAANRYTKIDPVVRTIALMLHFYNIFQKAMRTLLKGKVDHSDDDQVLRDVDALVGAPVDVIVHQRKLQAVIVAFGRYLDNMIVAFGRDCGLWPYIISVCVV